MPLLENVPPVLRNLDPFLQFAGDYIPEVQSFFANLTAATNAHDKNGDFGESGPIQHYLRGLISIGPESLASLQLSASAPTAPTPTSSPAG